MARLLALVTALLVVAATPTWADEADEADDLVAQGNELARNRDFAQAIEKFKAADRARPRVQNICMIGLANLRRQHLAQAEVYLERCRSRVAADDPAPEWLADAEAQLAAQLAATDVAAVDIQVVPASARVKLSSFSSDESFEPRILHLTSGPHTITASAPGFATATKEIVVVARTDQAVELVLAPEASVVPPPVVGPTATPLDVAPPPIEHGGWSTRLLVAGAGAVVGAVVLHALAFHTREALANPASADAYHAHEGTFELERAGAISMYALAGAAIGLGLYLRLTPRDRGTRIGATFAGGAGLVTIGWTR
ncbi:MAG: hypothetical protein NT062_07045 [Proteobacteria bacterium]|nr:hypothetical protein [Pseudomonadota bacterium]